MNCRAFSLYSLFALLPLVLLSQNKRIDSLEGVVANTPPGEPLLRTYRTLIEELARVNQPKAKQAAHQSLALATEMQLPSYQSAAYSWLVTLNQDMGMADSAAWYLERFEAFANGYQGELHNKVQGNYHQAAGLFYKNRGNVKAAVPHQQAAIKYGNLAGDKTFEAGMHLNLGNTYSEMGMHQPALNSKLAALKLFEQLGNERGQSFCLNGIGITFYHLRQYERALVYARRSLEMKEKFKDPRGIQTAYSLLGEVYAGMNNFAEAEKAYNESLRLASELKQVKPMAQTHYNKGMLYKALKIDSLAVVHFEQAMVFAQQSADTGVYAMARREKLGLEQGRIAAGRQESAIHESLKLSQSAGRLQEQMASHQQLAGFYSKHGKATFTKII